MKKTIGLFLCLCLVLALVGCGAQTAPAEQEIKDWTREGIFQDENENVLTITWQEDGDEPSWYAGVMIGELMAGWKVRQVGNTLQGDLNAWDENAEPYNVTISEEGEDGLMLVVEGGETYHFTPMDLPEATIFITINTEGMGNIAYTEGEETPEVDPEYPFQSAQINLAEPATHTILAWPQAGNLFVKWTKNGEDFSTEPQITVLLDESADYVAVFEEDPGWQNPVMNFVGEYQCDRANAKVDCFGYDEAWITIEWGSSAAELTRWILVGRLDTETLTVEYSGGTESIVTVDDQGEESQETVSVDGTGTVVFHDDGTFTWHNDQSDSGEDMVFQWLPVAEG